MSYDDTVPREIAALVRPRTKCSEHSLRIKSEHSDLKSLPRLGGSSRSAYISGPISGLPDGNREAFARAARHLRGQGVFVIDPCEGGSPSDAEVEAACAREGVCDFRDTSWYQQLLTKDIAAVLQCDAIVMLPGWENSRGAVAEHAVAEITGKRVILWSDYVADLWCFHGIAA